MSKNTFTYEAHNHKMSFCFFQTESLENQRASSFEACGAFQSVKFDHYARRYGARGTIPITIAIHAFEALGAISTIRFVRYLILVEMFIRMAGLVSEKDQEFLIAELLGKK